MTRLDHTHDAAARSWLAAANSGGDFPIQNLPFSIFRRAGTPEPFRGGVAIGDQVVDLAALSASSALDGLAGEALATCTQPHLNAFMAMGRPAWRALRHGLFALLAEGASGADRVRPHLVPKSEVEFELPARIGDYTDFYTSFDHAQNIGRLFSNAPDVVAPNFHWLPVAYHGRASSVVVSGSPIRRPVGQARTPGQDSPTVGSCAWLDYEVELGVFVGPGNPLGSPIPIEEADDHLFGICLLNDWSARDIQGWEMAPLGPFLAKNFSTTISPWIVTMEALEAFRAAWTRASPFPGPPAYLDDPSVRDRGAIDIQMEGWLETPARRKVGFPAIRLSHTSFRHQHWTVAQMLSHHTVGGCNLNSGDLLGTGTISGPTPSEAGAMMELSQAGRKPVRFGEAEGLPEERSFLGDGDTLVIRGWCEREGFARIGFGECRGTIGPARTV